ncbi:hypothetical protein V1951_19685 [Yersinia sp. 2544 StPb PI]|uniref:hypothetical protein n=1 Tax=Yersinia sp. 2544 StPb PI TaxID=3117409 RepID=UPI003B286B7D
MSAYDITVGRIRTCAQSAVAFVVLVSEMETALLTIRALTRCGVPDDIDDDGFPSRAVQIVWMAEQFGQACELKLIPDCLFQRYVLDLIRLGHEVDEGSWTYGFKSGVNIAQESLWEE